MTLEQLTARHRLVLPKSTGHWHVLNEQPIGQINGLETVRGKMVAISDKGLCLIETGDGGCVQGHKDWFIADAVEREAKEPKTLESRLDEFSLDLELIK